MILLIFNDKQLNKHEQCLPPPLISKTSTGQLCVCNLYINLGCDSCIVNSVIYTLCNEYTEDRDTKTI